LGLRQVWALRNPELETQRLNPASFHTRTPQKLGSGTTSVVSIYSYSQLAGPFGSELREDYV